MNPTLQNIKATALHVFVCVLALLFCSEVGAQSRSENDTKIRENNSKIRAGFYNVQNLFDTIDSPFVYDSDFTADGRYEWNGARYKAKIQAVTKVIDAIGADIIALSELENEGVVKDLVRAAEIDYGYFHYNSSDSRGIDIAVLYRPEKFFVDSTRAFKISGHSREIITLFGSVGERRIIFSACHLPSMFNAQKTRLEVAQKAGEYFRSLAAEDPEAVCIISGDFNFTPRSKNMKALLGREKNPTIVNTMADLEGVGTYTYGNKRMIYDYILLNKQAKSSSKTRIFVDENLVERAAGGQVAIKPTYRGGRYIGGTSDHLPVIIDVY